MFGVVDGPETEFFSPVFGNYEAIHVRTEHKPDDFRASKIETEGTLDQNLKSRLAIQRGY